MLTSEITTDIQYFQKENNFSVYPNPANDFLLINTPLNLKEKTYLIQNLQGQIIKSQKIDANDFWVATSMLERGFYFLSIDEHTIQFLKIKGYLLIIVVFLDAIKSNFRLNIYKWKKLLHFLKVNWAKKL